MKNALKISTGLFFLMVVAAGPFLPFVSEGLSFFTYHALTGLMPIKHQIAHAFLNGEYPLWNPWMLSGVPFHSGIGIADPLLLSYLFSDGIPALLFSSYFALCIAGISMFFYLLRIWRLPGTAAAAGGVLYALNPFFAATCHESPFMAPPAYLPLVFLFYEESLSAWRFSKALLSGFFLSLVFLSGNLESFFLAVLFFLALQTVRLFSEKPLDPSRLLKRFLWLGIPIFFSGLIAAIDLLPTLDVMRVSSRALNLAPLQQVGFFALIAAGAVVVTQVEWQRFLGPVFRFVQGGTVIGILVLFTVQIEWGKGFVNFAPNLFFPDVQKLMLHGQDAFALLRAGAGVPAELLRNFLDPRFIFYVQPPVYLFALTTLCLFVAGLFDPKDRLLAAWGAFALLIAVPPFTSLPNIFHYIFHFDLLAYPRLMFAFFFTQSVVVAYGFHRLTSEDLRISPGMRRVLLASGAGMGLAGLGFCLVYGFGQFDPLTFELALGDLASPGAALGDWLRRSWRYQTLVGESLKFFLAGEPWLRGFLIVKYAAITALPALFFSPRRLWRLFFILILAFEAVASWNFYVFQNDDVRAVVKDFKETEFLRSLSPFERVAIRNDPSLGIMNFYDRRRPFDWAANIPLFWDAATIEGGTLNLSPRSFSDFWALEPENTYTPTELRVPHSVIYDLMGMNYLFSDLPLVSESYSESGKGTRYHIYKNRHALPRVYFAKGLEPLSFEAAGEWIRNKSWEPGEKTLIDAHALPDQFDKDRPVGSDAKVRLLRQQRNVFDVEADSSVPALLATTHAFNHNWTAFVDGVKKVPVKINAYFLGLFLEPGNHQIHFRYQPDAFKAGRVITLGALLFMIAAMVVEKVWSGRKERL